MSVANDSLTTADPATAPRPASQRALSLDAYRGIVMLLLVFFDAPNGWTTPIKVAQGEGSWAATLATQWEHVDWAGLALWDMIQPSFMFVAGAAAAYSFASRARRGHSFWRLLGHAVYRAILLILLGVFLRSLGSDRTNWTLEDVVTQIGLGYVFLFLLWNCRWQTQVAATAAILVGYWALFACWPAPDASYDYAAMDGRAYYDGFQSHWNKNAHPAHYFDQWLLNQFPRSEPFAANDGGYNTLNFVPSLATMLLGLLAGELLGSDASAKRKFWTLTAGGVGCGVLGLAMHFGGVCPIVKRIWTPSFALASGGICLLTLALLYALVDLAGWRKWTFPAVIVGRNPLAAYVLIHTIARWLVDNVHRHFGEGVYRVFGAEYQPLLENLSVGAVVWLVCYWMDRRQIYLKL